MSQLLCKGRALQDGGSPLAPRHLTVTELDDKMDLKDAYLQVPIHPYYQNFLTIQWKKKSMGFNAYHLAY